MLFTAQICIAAFPLKLSMPCSILVTQDWGCAGQYKMLSTACTAHSRRGARSDQLSSKLTYSIMIKSAVCWPSTSSPVKGGNRFWNTKRLACWMSEEMPHRICAMIALSLTSTCQFCRLGFQNKSLPPESLSCILIWSLTDSFWSPKGLLGHINVSVLTCTRSLVADASSGLRCNAFHQVEEKLNKLQSLIQKHYTAIHPTHRWYQAMLQHTSSG